MSTNITKKMNKSNGQAVVIPKGTDLNKKKGKEKKQIEFTASYLIEKRVIEIPCLIEPFFQKVGLAAIAGSSDTGKTSLLRQLAINVASGKDFLGFKNNATRKSAIYVSTEDDENAISYLLHKYQDKKGLPLVDYDGLRYIFETQNLLERLDESLIRKPADLVVIDAFTDLYSKSMNESNQVRTFLNEYSQLAQKHKCLIVFLHHTGKRTENEPPSKNHLLGSQAFEAKMRLVIELRQDYADPHKRHFCVVKGNYLSNEYKNESYVLNFDDSLTFTNLNERVSFNLLAKPQAGGDKKNKYKKAMELKEQGKNYDEIAKEIGYRSKSSVSKLIKDFEGVS